MLKIKKKKILAMIVLFLTLFNIIQPTIFAANQTISGSGSDKFMARQYATRYRTTDEGSNTENGIIARRLIRRNENWNFSNGDGILVFCAQNHVPFATGTNYDGNYYVPTNADLKKASKVAYFGWYQSRGTYASDGNFADPSSLKQYAFTQQLIWETLNQSSAHFVDSSVQAEYEAFKVETNNKMNRMTIRPSFDGSTITLRVGETSTATDTNDVLKDYNSIDRTENNIRITHTKGENTMSFTPNENCNIENYSISDSKFQEWGLIKEGTEDNQTTVYIEFQSSDVQDQLYSLGYNDPITLRVNLTIEAKGRLELIKTNDNKDLVDGSVFIVTGPNNYYNEVTVSGGKIVLEDLLKGFYNIKEKSAKSSYLVNTETYTVEIKPNETTTKTIVNKEPTRNYNSKKRE